MGYSLYDSVYPILPAFLSLRALWPNLAIPVDNILIACQGKESHGASGMQLLCADADLRTEAELEAVRETGGGIHIDCRRIDLV